MEELKILGKGLDSICKLVKIGDEHFCRKEIQIKNKKHSERIKEEIRLLDILKHKNIVTYINHIIVDKSIFIITELLRYNLFTDCKNLNKQELKIIAKNIGQGLHHIHSKGCIHRDIKPHNIMYNTPEEVKIIDFGFAIEAENSSEQFGSPNWLAPEIIKEEKYTASVDVWSYGATIYYIFTKKYPIKIKSIKDLKSILNGPDLTCLKGNFLDFISKTMAIDPEKRITMSEVLIHPFLNIQSEN